MVLTHDPLPLTPNPSRFIERSFNRKGPSVVQLIDREVDATSFAPLTLLHIDDEPIASHRPDLHRWNTGVPGAIQDLVGHLWLHRKNHPRLALTEQEGIQPQGIEG